MLGISDRKYPSDATQSAAREAPRIDSLQIKCSCGETVTLKPEEISIETHPVGGIPTLMIVFQCHYTGDSRNCFLDKQIDQLRKEPHWPHPAL